MFKTQYKTINAFAYSREEKKKTNQLCMSIGFQIKNYGGVPSIFASAIHTEI